MLYWRIQKTIFSSVALYYSFCLECLFFRMLGRILHRSYDKNLRVISCCAMNAAKLRAKAANSQSFRFSFNYIKRGLKMWRQRRWNILLVTGVLSRKFLMGKMSKYLQWPHFHGHLKPSVSRSVVCSRLRPISMGTLKPPYSRSVVWSRLRCPSKHP